MLRVDAARRSSDLHFDATFSEVVDRSTVEDVAVDRGRPVAFNGLDDVGAVFEASPEMNVLLAAQHRLDRFVVIASPARPVVGVEAAFSKISRARVPPHEIRDRKSTRLNSSHPSISYAVFC